MILALLAALLIGAPKPTPAVHVAVVTAPCPAYGPGWTCYQVETHTIYIARFDRFTYLHEIGHAVDWQLLLPADRSYLGQFFPSPDPWVGGTDWGKDEEF